MRTPTLASTTDMQGGSFEEPGPYMYPSVHAHTHTHCYTCFQGRWRSGQRRIGAQYRRTFFDCGSCSLMVLMKAFEFLHPVLRDAFSIGPKKNRRIGRRRRETKRVHDTVKNVKSSQKLCCILHLTFTDERQMGEVRQYKIGIIFCMILPYHTLFYLVKGLFQRRLNRAMMVSGQLK